MGGPEEMRMGKRGRRKRKKQLCVGHFAMIQGGKAAPLLPSLARPSTAAFFHCWLRDRDRDRDRKRIESERI